MGDLWIGAFSRIRAPLPHGEYGHLIPEAKAEHLSEERADGVALGRGSRRVPYRYGGSPARFGRGLELPSLATSSTGGDAPTGAPLAISKRRRLACRIWTT